jgi:L-erythro-3,5-diaminohexanoate dehydrogenase
MIEVDLLHVDATSFGQIARECDRDPSRMAARIVEIVSARGTLQNPVTGSGGVARGRVLEVGASSHTGAAVGDLVVPLVSLIALPLVLDEMAGRPVRRRCRCATRGGHGRCRAAGARRFADRR